MLRLHGYERFSFTSALPPVFLPAKACPDTGAANARAAEVRAHCGYLSQVGRASQSSACVPGCWTGYLLRGCAIGLGFA